MRPNEASDGEPFGLFTAATARGSSDQTTPNVGGRSIIMVPISTPPAKEIPDMLELMVTLHTWAAQRHADIQERGATAVEYALMVGLIAIAIVTAVSLFGAKVQSTFNSVANTMPG